MTKIAALYKEYIMMKKIGYISLMALCFGGFSTIETGFGSLESRQRAAERRHQESIKIRQRVEEKRQSKAKAQTGAKNQTKDKTKEKTGAPARRR